MGPRPNLRRVSFGVRQSKVKQQVAKSLLFLLKYGLNLSFGLRPKLRLWPQPNKVTQCIPYINEINAAQGFQNNAQKH